MARMSRRAAGLRHKQRVVRTVVALAQGSERGRVRVVDIRPDHVDIGREGLPHGKQARDRAAAWMRLARAYETGLLARPDIDIRGERVGLLAGCGDLVNVARDVIGGES